MVPAQTQYRIWSTCFQVGTIRNCRFSLNRQICCRLFRNQWSIYNWKGTEEEAPLSQEKRLCLKLSYFCTWNRRFSVLSTSSSIFSPRSRTCMKILKSSEKVCSRKGENSACQKIERCCLFMCHSTEAPACIHIYTCGDWGNFIGHCPLNTVDRFQQL